ncbi:hypothetical protein BDW22DRAFT_1171654 [Trametopsis cervina]|nr:hypothetical protein BDW22DRAFT_1171654 [Trametopsis cervina]
MNKDLHLNQHANSLFIRYSQYDTENNPNHRSWNVGDVIIPIVLVGIPTLLFLTICFVSKSRSRQQNSGAAPLSRMSITPADEASSVPVWPDLHEVYVKQYGHIQYSDTLWPHIHVSCSKSLVKAHQAHNSTGIKPLAIATAPPSEHITGHEPTSSSQTSTPPNQHPWTLLHRSEHETAHITQDTTVEVAVTVALPHRSPDFIQGGTRTRVRSSPPEICIGLTRVDVRVR